MARGSVMAVLTVAITMALLMTVAATKEVKTGLSQENASVMGPAHIELMVSLNEEEPHSIEDDLFADFKMGDKVSLICITEGYPEELLDLSWWEGEQPLRYIRQEGQFVRSSATTLEDLTAEDSGRTFSCRADDSTQTRTVTLRLDFSSGDDSKDEGGSQLHVIVNHEVAMSGDGLLLYGTGHSISLVCLMQGPDAKRVSWWEEEEELVPSGSTLRKLSSSSTLVLRDLEDGDSGRQLSCRVDDSTMERSVQLLQAKYDVDFSPKTGNMDQVPILNIVGKTTTSEHVINTTTIITIWAAILAFIAVSLVCAKIYVQRTPGPQSSKSSSAAARGNNQKVAEPGKRSGSFQTENRSWYSRLEPVVLDQAQKNRMFIFMRRSSMSAVATACAGDTAQTHGKNTAMDEAHANPGFVSNV